MVPTGHSLIQHSSVCHVKSLGHPKMHKTLPAPEQAPALHAVFREVIWGRGIVYPAPFPVQVISIHGMLAL